MLYGAHNVMLWIRLRNSCDLLIQAQGKGKKVKTCNESLIASETSSPLTLSFLIPRIPASRGDCAPHLQRLAEMQILTSSAADGISREGYLGR